jgi:TonB family protein
MSNPTESWKNWEGRVADNKFPLRKLLGGSGHSAVFLTERSGAESQKAVIKLIRAENLDQDAQLSRWATAAKLSHPHLIRLFECGRCAIAGTPLLYVVMEYAEENLAEILPLRALAPEEASEMLQPTAEALDYLHQSDLAHGRIRPSNIMAVDNQLKISADGIAKIGERSIGHEPNAYDAPEVAITGPSSAADIFALGKTLLAVMSQNEGEFTNGTKGSVAVPETIPEPFSELAQQCLQLDPQKRPTAASLLSPSPTPNIKTEVPIAARAVEVVEAAPQKEPSRKRFVIPILIAAIVLIAWAGSKFVTHRPTEPATESRGASSPSPAATPAAQSPPPLSENKKPVPKGLVRGGVLQQVLPEVSRGAQNTIQGHVKVSVQVSVDASGNVSQAKLVSAGPSKYFADRALAAARSWKFTPPQVDGQAAASEWILRFQFGRGSTQVFPAETKP